MRRLVRLRTRDARWALLVLAAALAPTASAAPGALDGKRLALQPSDLPASAQRMSEKANSAAALPGGTGEVYATTFQFRVGRRTEAVGVLVVTAPTAAVAGRAYAAAISDARKRAVAAVQLPRLGDEQYAALYGRPSLDETSGAVWVRQGTVVWQVQVSSVSNPFGFSKAAARAELTKYALKQKHRVRQG